ncbi:MAG: M28 family peptidase [Gemmatimonadota bacterium]
MRTVFTALIAIIAASTPAIAQTDPQISGLVGSISADTLRSYLTTLVGFGTRHTLSDTVSTTRGIGAARRWIHSKFQQFSRACGGCLEVEYDAHFAANARTRNDTVRIVNVIARLPGRSDPDRLIIVEGHYDSCICSVSMTDAESDAPGANDDGSGTVAVMELARVFSRTFPRGLEATVLFVAVAGEEQGLLGSTGLANELAADTTVQVYAALTSDIAGNVHGQKGGVDSTSIRVFSGEPTDGPSRQLARYIEEIGERFVPRIAVRVIVRLDRIGRGGDHIPFWNHGYAAVRFTESLENYLHQHRPEDRIEFVSFPYIQKLARVNGAATASLALAPAPPDSLRMRRVIESGGSDWDLSWKPPRVATGVAGYEVTIRSTTEPRISKVVPVGNVTTYLLKDTQADDLWIGIRAVGENGQRSLVRSFHGPERMPGPRR